MVNAGMSILEAMRTLSEHQDHPVLANVLPKLCARVETGLRVSEAMAEFPGVFAKPVRFMVQAGEESGQICSLLSQVASWMQKEAEVAQRTRQALVYPATVIGIALLLGWVLFAFFLPPFLEGLTGSGIPLPWLTRVVLWMSRVLGHPLVWLLSLACLTVIRRELAKRSQQPGFRLRQYQLIRSIPLLGRIAVFTSTVRFANCLAVLLECGLPLIQSWTLAAAASGDATLQEDARRVVATLREGEFLRESLQDSTLYPRGFAGMIGVAEETASLPRTLTSMARVYDHEAEYLTQTLSLVFEPLFIAVLAAMVVVLILSILLPLYGSLAQMSG